VFGEIRPKITIVNDIGVGDAVAWVVKHMRLYQSKFVWGTSMRCMSFSIARIHFTCDETGNNSSTDCHPYMRIRSNLCIRKL
jgi:hypothetical protein